MHLVIVEVI